MAYIGNQPVLLASEFREEFPITANTTQLTTSGFVTNSNSEFVEVYRNGVLLGKDDYTLGTDGATITLTNAAVNGDIVVVTGRRDATKNQTDVGEYVEEFTISGSSTTYVDFSYPLNPSFTHVFLNGVKMASTDITMSSATRRITFGSALANGDVVVVVSRSLILASNDRVTHQSLITDNITVPTGQNTAFFGDTEFSGTININGKMVVAHGEANFTGTTNLVGTLNIV